MENTQKHLDTYYIIILYLIGIPRGCETALCAMLGDVINSFTIVDKTNSGESIPVEFDGKLREEQAVAATELLNHNIGVLSATTAFGKTVIASYIASQRKTNTLILVHTQALMLQWKKSLEQFLTFDITPPEPQKRRGRKKVWSPVGLLAAGKDTLTGIVDGHHPIIFMQCGPIRHRVDAKEQAEKRTSPFIFSYCILHSSQLYIA